MIGDSGVKSFLFSVKWLYFYFVWIKTLFSDKNFNLFTSLHFLEWRNGKEKVKEYVVTFTIGYDRGEVPYHIPLLTKSFHRGRPRKNTGPRLMRLQVNSRYFTFITHERTGWNVLTPVYSVPCPIVCVILRSFPLLSMLPGPDNKIEVNSICE